MSINTHKTQDVVDERIRAALNLYIGRGRLFSVEALSEASAIPESTLRSYLNGCANVPFSKALILMRYLPESFTNLVLENAGFCGAERMQAHDTSHPNKVLSDTLKLTSNLAIALEDGRLDHMERAKLKNDLPGLIAMLQRFASDLN